MPIPIYRHTCILFVVNSVTNIPVTPLSSVQRNIEKIVVQDSRNTGEQLGIDILFAEYLVHIGPAAREFAGKPSDTALLGFQSLFNEFPYRFHSEKILLTVPIRRFNITTKRGTEHSHRSLKVVGNPRYRYEIAAHARDAREPPCLTLYLV